MKFYQKRGKAIEFIIDCSNYSVEEFATKWLILCNNAREYKNMILKIACNSKTMVFVYAPVKESEIVKDWLYEIFSKAADLKESEIDVIGVETIVEEKDYQQNYFPEVLPTLDEGDYCDVL